MPRDRIYNVLGRLSELWMRYPDQRLGQLLLNITRDDTGATSLQTCWNVTDEEIRERIERALKDGL